MLFKNFNKHYQTKLYTQLKQNRSYSLNFLLFYQHNNNSTKLIINTYSHSPRLNEQKNRKESLERLKNVSRGPYETIRREKQILQQSLENHARVSPKQSIFVNIISLILTPYYPGNSISLNIRCTPLRYTSNTRAKRVQHRINVDCLRDEIRRSPTIASMSNFPKIQAIGRGVGMQGEGRGGQWAGRSGALDARHGSIP